ncbi:unnamed protein product [Victoria cruziana]
MGTSDSKLLRSQPVDEITTVAERIETVDPLLERLRSLKVTTPILKTPPTESSLSDILVRKPSSSSNPGALDPKVLLELFTTYYSWQEDKAKKISEKQEELENKIEIADALAIKLSQRFNYSLSSMRTTAQHLSNVHQLQVEVGELKGRLTEVLSNCDALCKRISLEGPETLRSTVKPFSTGKRQIDRYSSSEMVPEDSSK